MRGDRARYVVLSSGRSSFEGLFKARISEVALAGGYTLLRLVKGASIGRDIHLTRLDKPRASENI